MTVAYTAEVATCRGLGNFRKLLARWKGSIYKVLWAEIIVYLVCFYGLNIFYRQYLSLNCEKKKYFIRLIKYCDNFGKDIPLAFVLNFYVGNIVTRWWNQWLYMPWPDTVAITTTSTVDGSDDRGRLIRRTIMRYTNLCFVLTLTLMSTPGKTRFPTLKHLVEAGFLLENERAIIEEMDTKTNHPKYWVPIVWAGSIARRARKEGKIRDDISLNNLITALNSFRSRSQEMLNYDWVNMPLVYTQVVTLAVYSYFMAGIVGKQLTFISSLDDPQDFYFPFFGFFEFFFYFGWLKVAETLINPYGLDDDDFEVNWIIDRDLTVSYFIVDEMHQEHPNLLKDQYWDEVVPIDIPYTEAAAKYKTTEGQTGSTKYVDVPIEKQDFVRAVETVTVDDEKSGDRLGRNMSHRSLNRSGSRDSLSAALKTVNSTARARRYSRLDSTDRSDRRGSWTGKDEDLVNFRGSITSLAGGRRNSSLMRRASVTHEPKLPTRPSNMTLPAASRSKFSIKKLKSSSDQVKQGSGYWQEPSGSNKKGKVNVAMLMEQDDIPYVPELDTVSHGSQQEDDVPANSDENKGDAEDEAK